ncbi:tRNA (adenine-N(1)-)-methyltransferase [Aspergillus homomorphus CBS 101889]|uniref:tRNA (adenine(58)-N(1))-methyltransferase catalytic subunit TRM61 n=1 Tax=Aspergillus homomorphus (strain CBS 101889) TaxID=1450537 RepID=A0A395IAH2_ASPHC|nr:hypothetical protein BO97DRAFT_474254 [Aspergillus homomorphus CBS 101889]RAL17167.1 hypothetical protein BO97DRAFT_474254 [Aspergillus homomorphus CBS 101889]
MARLLQALRRILGSTPSPSPTIPTPSVPSQSVVPRRFPSIDTNFTYFREGDRVFIPGRTPLLTKPLRKGGRTDARRGGQLEHDDIIGRRVRDLIPARKGPAYRLFLPTLEDYVALTPRLVTPIYSADANLIVSLLDIHVAPSSDPDQPPLEILESGTGHGSLTLHLARAIQGANSVPPPFPAASQVVNLVPSPSSSSSSSPTATPRSNPETTTTTETEATEATTTQENWDAWRAQRKAIIHTVDITRKTARHAETLVRGFRRGIYAGNVDFSAGPVETWVAAQKQQRSRRHHNTRTSFVGESDSQTATPAEAVEGKEGEVEPFLSYAILDMPSAHLRIPHVASILKRDGLLAVFMPSVTQIGDCMEVIRRERLPLVQEKVVELGQGISSGRLWDVRFAYPKAKDPLAVAAASGAASGVEEGVEAQEEAGEAVVSAGEEVADGGDAATTASSTTSSSGVTEESQDPVLVCRPKVGLRIVGGGFVGIWRRIEGAGEKVNANANANVDTDA